MIIRRFLEKRKDNEAKALRSAKNILTFSLYFRRNLSCLELLRRTISLGFLRIDKNFGNM